MCPRDVALDNGLHMDKLVAVDNALNRIIQLSGLPEAFLERIQGSSPSAHLSLTAIHPGIALI